MCQSIAYQIGGCDVRVRFSQRDAQLPVKTKRGVAMLPWGRRKTQAGDLPLGGWVSLEAIRRGGWEQWFPVPVKLMVDHFMVLDIEGHAHWHHLISGKSLQGLVARYQQEQRVYVVMVESDLTNTYYERWPRIVTFTALEHRYSSQSLS